MASLIATIESVNAYAKSEAERKKERYFPLNDLQKANASLMYDIATKNGLDPAMAIGQMYLETRLKPYPGTNKEGARGASQFIKGTAKQYGIDWDKLGSDITYDYEAYAKLMKAEIASGKVKNAYDAGVLYHAGPDGLLHGTGVGPLTKAYASGVDSIVRGASGPREFAIAAKVEPKIDSKVTPQKPPATPEATSLASQQSQQFESNPIMTYEKARSAYAADAVAAYRAEDQMKLNEQLGVDGKPAEFAQLAQFEYHSPSHDKMIAKLGEMWDATSFYKDNRKLSEDATNG